MLNASKSGSAANKSEKKGLYFSSYLWENVFCELCKDNFTENVVTQYGVVNILGIETPKNDNYIILEALNSEEILKKNTKIGKTKTLGEMLHGLFHIHSAYVQFLLLNQYFKLFIVHIIDFKHLSELSVGRGHDNQVRITDISISRLH